MTPVMLRMNASAMIVLLLALSLFAGSANARPKPRKITPVVIFEPLTVLQTQHQYRNQHTKKRASAKSGQSKRSSSSDIDPTVPTQVTVRVLDHILSYFITGMDQLPSEDDVEQLRQVTEAFWTQFFGDYYTENILFKGVTLQVEHIELTDANSISIEYDVQVFHDLGTANPTDARETLDIMIALADLNTRYLEDFVQTVPAFANTVFVQINRAGNDVFPTAAPSTIAPTGEVTAFPTLEITTIELPQFIYGYHVPELTQEPSDSQLADIVQATQFFLFSDLSFSLFETGYSLVDLTVEEVGSEFSLDGFFAPFNYFVVYHVTVKVATFEGDDASSIGDDFYQQFILSADVTSYILDYLRFVPGFESTVNVVPERAENEAVIQIKVADHYIAYSDLGLIVEPTGSELEGLVDVTQQYWTDYFTAYFLNRDEVFTEAQLEAVVAYFEGEIPNGVYNYWVNYSLTLLFDGEGSSPPNPDELLGLMKNATLDEYVSEYVAPGTVLATADEAVVGALQGTTTANVILLTGLRLSFEVIELTEEPSSEDVALLIEGTRAFYHSYLTDYFFREALLGYANVELDVTSAGIDNFFILDFGLIVSFASGFTLPTEDFVLSALLFEANYERYRRTYVIHIESFVLTRNVGATNQLETKKSSGGKHVKIEENVFDRKHNGYHHHDQTDETATTMISLAELLSNRQTMRDP